MGHMTITDANDAFRRANKLMNTPICPTVFNELIDLINNNNSLQFNNKQLKDEVRILNIIINKRWDQIAILNAKDQQWIEMYNDLIAKHEALKAKWWYKLFTKLESWKK